MYIKQNGAGFIEVLVALVILAIGLLGVLSMQARGLNSNQRALFASEVNLLALDMADRMMAYGITGADAGEYDGLSTTGNVVLGDAIADADRLAWATAMNASSLPSVIGDVTWVADVDNGGVYTISIRWDETRQGIIAGALADDCGATPVLNLGVAQRLSCYQLTVTL